MSEHTILLAITTLICLPLALALAASGLPALTAALSLRSPKRLKVFRDKFGQQMSTFALFSGFLALLALAAGATILAVRLPDVALFWLGWPLPDAPLAGCLALAACLLLVYRASWHAMAAQRPAHALLGLLASAFGTGFGFVALAAMRHFLLSPTKPVAETAFFLPEKASAVWLLTPVVLCLSLGAAAAIGACYLLARRDKDDFGRDYYNYAVKLCAKIALGGCLASVFPQMVLVANLWGFVRELPVRSAFFWCHAVSGASVLLACLLWAMVLRNKNPLRMKLHILIGAALFWVAVSGQLGGYAVFYLG